MTTFAAPDGFSTWVKRLGDCHLQKNGEPTTVCGMPMLGNHYKDHPHMVKCEKCWAAATGEPVPKFTYVWVEVRAIECQRYLCKVPSNMLAGTIVDHFDKALLANYPPHMREAREEEIEVEATLPSDKDMLEFKDKAFDLEEEAADG